MISTEFAAVLNVLLLPANFIVEVSNLLPVASCVSTIVADDPDTTFAMELKVILPVSVYVKIDPAEAFGVRVAAPVLPPAITVSPNFSKLTLVMLAPVELNTATLLTPLTPIVTLLFEATATLLVPFVIEVGAAPE